MAKVAIVFWSGTGHTEKMAHCIMDGLKAGGAQVELFPVSKFSADKLDSYDKIAFGCPAMGSEELEPDEFEPFFASIESKLAGRKIALFGSYEWASGEEGLIAYDDPDEEAQKKCKEFGERFAK